MFSRFTASARRVMQRAFREAKRCQHDFVGTAHLLYGLLCDTDGPAVGLLRALNARPELMLEKVALSMRALDSGMAMERFPLSPASRRVIASAQREAATFRHQLIGPEHLLLGLVCEHECEAAQILSAHHVTLEALRAAVVQAPPDSFLEAQMQAPPAPSGPLTDNPAADELERWLAAPITVDTPDEHARADLANPLAIASIPAVEAQLRLTQILLGCVIGYTYGHWLSGWLMGLFMAAAGFGIALFRSSWLGAFLGTCCGLIITPMFHRHLTHPFAPIFFAVLGGFLGSFLGDGWRFTRQPPAEPPPPGNATPEQTEPNRNVTITPH